jgi:predicted ATPase
MNQSALYISRIDIEGLWHRYNISWNLRPDVNILSGMNGIGKTTILSRTVNRLSEMPLAQGHEPREEDVHIRFAPDEADHIRYDVIRSYAYAAQQSKQLEELTQRYAEGNFRAENKEKFQALVDRLFGYTGKQVDRTAAELRFLQDNDLLPPRKLSSGEKQLLIILLTVLMRDGQPCALFVDEPEASLHIEWQQQLISLIRALNPNAQLILATHSPAIIMDGWMDAVTEMSDITTPAQP